MPTSQETTRRSILKRSGEVDRDMAGVRQANSG
jgi:hypothetical protein